MKKYLFLSLLLPIISWQTLLAQSSYTLTIERANESLSYCAIATENNEVLAVVNRFGAEEGIAELIRIDANGNIIDSLVFSSVPNRFYKISKIGQSIHEATYFGLGLQWGDNELLPHLWIFEFDDDFNIQWEQIIDTIDYEPIFMQFRHWNNHYFIGVFINNSKPSFLYKVTEYGELLKRVSVPYPEEPNSHAPLPVFYIRQMPETSHFLMNRGFDDWDTAVMDDDLNYLYSTHYTIYPNQNPNITFPLDLEFFNNTEFIRSGLIEKTKNDYRDLLAVKKMDTASRNEALVRKFGYEGFEKERGCHPGAFKALAMHPDYFYAGGYAYRTYAPNNYPEFDNFIMVYAFNYDLDSLWATQIGNDAYYMLFYISPTPDGGCVLAGSRYDWRKEGEKRDAFIAKIPKPDITSISEAEKPKPLVTIFPNPGNDMLTIDIASDDFTFRLYDLTGKLVLEQQNQKTISTQHLPAGMYLYQIYSEYQSVTSGKWVKI